MATGRTRVAYLLLFAAVVIALTIGEPFWVRAAIGAVAVAPLVVADRVTARRRAARGTGSRGKADGAPGYPLLRTRKVTAVPMPRATSSTTHITSPLEPIPGAPLAWATARTEPFGGPGIATGGSSS